MDHPHFVQHNDYRETFRLSEINDPTCKLLIVTDDGLEILRRALKCAHKRENWIDAEDADGYITPDDSDWDDISSTLDDLEYQLMSVCDYVTLDDVNERVGINVTPVAKLHVAGTSTYNSDTVKALRVSDPDTPAKAVDVGFDAALGKGFIQAGQFGVMYTDLLLNPNLGNVGIGRIDPAHKLDVNGALRAVGAFGCNSQVPQTAAALPSNASDLPTAISLLNAVVAALNANGITHQ